jgi:adducin
MMDNAGYRTGYIYRNPLVKHEVPKPKNDVEVPPAVSSLGYLLEEEEMYKQGYANRLKLIFKKDSNMIHCIISF